MASFCATNGKSEPCTAMEKSTTTKTMWKRSFSMVTGEITAMIANTTDAAPRKPAKDTSTLRARHPPNGAMNTNVATGRAMKVRKRAIASAGRTTSTICEGNESSPSRKKQAVPAVSAASAPHSTLLTVA